MTNFTSPLDNIRIASPCSADWNQMYGNDRKRFCGDCKLHVYNLSDMTRDEAENFLVDSEGPLCVQFFRRADGTVLTKNCPVGWRKVKVRAFQSLSAGATFIAALFTGIFSANLSSAISEHRSWKEKIATNKTASHAFEVQIPRTVPEIYRGETMRGGVPGDFLEEIRLNRKSKSTKRK